MVNLYRVILAFLFAATAALVGYAQDHVTTYANLSQLVELRQHDDGSLHRHIKHVDAQPSSDPLRPFDVLSTSGDAPNGTIPVASFVVHKWVDVGGLNDVLPQTPEVASRIIGSRAFIPVFATTVSPWKTEGGRLWVADSITVTTTFMVQQGIEPPRTDFPSAPENVPRSGTPTVKLYTRVDGIAMQTGAGIEEIEPALIGQPLINLALYYKNEEQPLHVIDADGSSTLTPSDTVLFRGWRPAGDTSWLDWDDSVAVHFLTIEESGTRLRYAYNESAPSGDAIVSLRTNRRIELDTGYYHLGSSNNPVLTEYNSDRVALEGFYWDALNTNGFERVEYRMPLAPATNGSVDITAHYVAATDAPAFDPDTRADLTVNAINSANKTTDGTGTYDVTVSTLANEAPHGIYTIKLYSTGIDEHRGKPGYFSEVLLDWIEVQADIEPVLENGVLDGHVDESTSQQQLRVVNAATSTGFILDTVQQTITRMSQVASAAVVRFGLNPQDQNWILTPWDGIHWRGSAIFDNDVVEVDSINDVVLVARTASGIEQSSLSASTIVNSLNGLANGTPFVIFNTGKPLPQNLINAMTSKGLSIPGEQIFAQGGVIGGLVDTRETAQPANLGAMVVDEARSSSRILAGSVAAGENRGLFVAEGSGIEIARVNRSNLADLRDETSQADVVIVTHSSHRAQAERLAQHREQFSNVTTTIVDIDAILDEFGAGHRSPDALREYLAYRYFNSDLPRTKYVILVGNASWDPRLAVKRGNAGSRRADQIPTYGRPSSDYYFGLLDDPRDYAVPEVIVGRLPGLLPEEVEHHVDKIIAHDTTRVQPWMRRFMFIGGGEEVEGLCDLYEDMLGDPFGTGITFTDPPLCIDTLTLCRYTAPPNAGFFIRQGIDAGVGWMNYIGHGSTEVFDITGWEPTDLTNAGKYGVMATYACQTGAFSNPSVECKNSQYLSVKERGFSASVGGTGWAFKITIDFLHFNMHQTLRDKPIRAIGDVVYQAKLPFGRGTDQNSINTVMQYCILGDPLMNVQIDTAQEVYLRSDEVTVTNTIGTTELTDEDDIAFVALPFHSAGLGSDANISVWLVREFDGKLDTLKTQTNGLCLSENLVFELPIKNMQGEHRVEIIADPFRITGDDESDNTANVVFTVLPRSLLPVHPLPHMVMDATDLHFRLLDPLSEADNPQTPTFVIANSTELSDETTVLRNGDGQIVRSDRILDWEIDLGSEPLSEGLYWLHAWTINPDNQVRSAPLIIPFQIAEATTTDTSTLVATALHRPLDATTVTYDESSDQFKLASTQKDVFIRSSGIRTAEPTVDPYLEIRIGDVLYVSNPFFRGINLVVVNEVDTLPWAIRRYDTWRDPLPIESGHNGFSTELIQFLRDSIGPQDRVLFASADESFTGIIQDGNLEELQTILKEMGSSFADSLAPRSSWAMVGQKGSEPESAPELWKGAPDSMVVLTTQIPFYSASGTITSPWVGPIKELGTVTASRSSKGVETFVEGRTRQGNVEVIGAMGAGDTWQPSEPTNVRFVRVRHEMTFEDDGSTEVFTSTTGVTYVPADEWVVSSSDLEIDPEEALRGDTIEASIKVRNAGLFRATQPTSITLSLRTEDGEERATTVDEIPAIDSDGTVELTPNISTVLASTPSIVHVQANAKGDQPELYDFNNSAERLATVNDDTVSPTIRAYADGIDVTDGAYVTPRPAIEVHVLDNSVLPINDEDNLTVFVNGDRIREGVTDDFEFLPTDSVRTYYEDPAIRAVLRFTYNMEPEQNNLLVRAKDATGNEVEHLAELWLATSTSIGSVRPSPNPSSGPVTFRVELRTPSTTSDAVMHIYDTKGRRIRSLNAVINAGQATIDWDGRSSDGSSIPTGLYVYRLEVMAGGSAGNAGTSGTVMILR